MSDHAISDTPIWTVPPPKVGWSASRSRRVEPDDIELFTRISGDRNPIHYDAAVAASSKLGEIVVQGGITTAILNAVVAEDLPGPGTVFLNTNLSFRAPVRPGDTITGTVEVLDVRTDKPITRMAARVTRQDGVVAVEGEVLCYTLPLPPA
jgi:acyl dehydratase